MPQMSPLQWEVLFLFFLLSIILVMNKIFYCFFMSDKTKETAMSPMSPNSFTWPW